MRTKNRKSKFRQAMNDIRKSLKMPESSSEDDNTSRVGGAILKSRKTLISQARTEYINDVMVFKDIAARPANNNESQDGVSMADTQI